MNQIRKHDTIIVMLGAASRGKTTSIGMLFNLLKGAGYTEDENFTAREPFTALGTDFIEVLEGKNEANVILRIGMASAGDNARVLEENLEELISAGCNILVCACRTRGETPEVILEFDDYLYRYFGKGDPVEDKKEQEKANMRDAHRLLAHIYKLIN